MSLEIRQEFLPADPGNEISTELNRTWKEQAEILMHDLITKQEWKIAIDSDPKAS